MKLSFLYLLVFIFALCACNNRPKEVLPEDKMVDLLTDLQLAEGYYNTVGPGKANRDAIINSVLTKHGVTQAQLDSTVAYYGRNIDDYYKLYGKVEKRIRNLSYTGTNDDIVESDDIWPYNRFAIMFPNQSSNGISFSIPADNVESGNLLEWKFRLPNQESVEATFGIEYSNGLISLSNRKLNGNRTISLELQTDTALTPVRVFGMMQSNQYARTLMVDSIKLVKTPFDSLSYYKLNSQKRIYPPAPKPRIQPVQNNNPTNYSISTDSTPSATPQQLSTP